MNYKTFNQLPTDAINIRNEVFVNEQGFHDEFDQHDAISTHIVLYDNSNNAIGTCRYYYDTNQNCIILGRIAICKNYRQKHYGYDLVNYAVNTIQALGYPSVIVSAQCQAHGFYIKLGFVAFGDIYYDEHCPHIRMKKVLQ